MAIYKNREVQIVISTVIPEETVTVTYPDGTTDHAKLSQIRLTKDEKASLEKTYAGRIDGVATASDEDVEAVRTGVAPSFDQEANDAADQKALQDRAQKVNADMEKKRQDEANKRLDSQKSTSNNNQETKK